MATNVKELLSTVRKYENKEIDNGEFANFIRENIQCRKYMPIKEKVSVIGSVMDFVGKNIRNKDIVDFSIKTECYLKLKLMFVYANIKHSNVNLNDKTYDIVCESGLMDLIVGSIGTDFYETIDMYNRIYLVNSIKCISEVINPPDLNVLKDVMKDFKDTLDHGKGIETLTKLVDGK